MKNKLIIIAASAIAAAALISFSGCTVKKTAEESKVSVYTLTEPQLRDENGIGYNPSGDGELIVTDIKPKGDTADIPSEYEGKKVTAIDRSAFKMTDIKKVVIPDTVKAVPDYAFAFCKSLEEAVLPDGITKIGKNAFCGCFNLKTVKLPESLSFIDIFAFDASGLEKITIPEKVVSIGEYAFAECSSLKKVVFKGKYTEVADNCFNKTTGVKVKAPKGSPVIEAAGKLGVEIE